MFDDGSLSAVELQALLGTVLTEIFFEFGRDSFRLSRAARDNFLVAHSLVGLSVDVDIDENEDLVLRFVRLEEGV